MSDIVGLFRATSAAEVAIRHSAVPTRVELMDITLVPFLQMDVLGADEFGIVRFENERELSGTLWKKAPFTIRLTPKGERPYLVDFPWPAAGE